MRINAEHTRWAVTTVACTAAATAVYVYTASTAPAGPSGGSWTGLFFGLAGALCMLLAAALAARKRRPIWRVGSALLWMKMHVWLGVLAVPLILFHSAFRWGGLLTTTIMLLFYGVIASGVVGLILQQFVPTLMRSRLPLETVHGQIGHVLDGLTLDAYELVASITGPIGEAVEEQARLAAEEELQRSRPTYWKQIVRQRPATDPHPLAGELRGCYLDEVRPYVRGGGRTKAPDLRRFVIEVPEWRGKLEKVVLICEEARQLRTQARLHTLLHDWLFVHVPLSCALLVLVGFHVYFALRY